MGRLDWVEDTWGEILRTLIGHGMIEDILVTTSREMIMERVVGLAEIFNFRTQNPHVEA
ncbi:hypothetical protein N825_28975 [Skermanella stibiiresistens SB22]|uniref:Uncharacterized protein n=1 Tax=Skermanella stibiiresistens SB22 TaxID=1385369 RepID=W9GXU8_9PROT|nr:hypothetical protein [Skermanella stibiiresistens]EWY36308.1 hypothetical protein N825_28975 [Skermanella stibiiresistens SB22]